MGPSKRVSSPLAYAGLLAAAVALAAGFVAVAPRLVVLGLSAPLFYVVLVPLGLASAAFLKQALSATSADVQARFWFGTVKVGGPVAVAALVVGGGMVFLQRGGPPPPAGPLALVVRVPASLRDVDLTHADLVVLAGQRSVRPESTAPAEARFVLDAAARAEQLRVSGKIPGYDVDEEPFSYPSDGVRWLALQAQQTVMTGQVVGPDGRPLDGATVVFDGGAVEATTREGAFRAILPRPPGTPVRVEVRFLGKTGYRSELTTPNDVTLRWSPP